MNYCEIFRVSESTKEEIFSELIEDGVVGLHGGRLEVRRMLAKIQLLIDHEELDSYISCLSINHPDTELGYALDTDKYSVDKAKEIVNTKYNQLEGY